MDARDREPTTDGKKKLEPPCVTPPSHPDGTQDRPMLPKHNGGSSPSYTSGYISLVCIFPLHRFETTRAVAVLCSHHVSASDSWQDTENTQGKNGPSCSARRR